MEIDSIFYKAKDGRIFTDPLKCEEYEKTIGILPGSVGDLIRELEKLNPAEYIDAIVMIKASDGNISFFIRGTVCLDDWLESYVNVNNLRESQRYMYDTVGNFAKRLKQLNKDDMCQYMVIHADNLQMSKAGIMANFNKLAWNKKEEVI